MRQLQEISRREGVSRYMEHEEVYVAMKLVDGGAIDLNTARDSKDIVFFMNTEERKKEAAEPVPAAEKEKAAQPVPDLPERVRKLYSSGKSMEQIAEETGQSIVVVSRIIDNLGLGKEKYKGKYIPSDGSAPVKSCMVGK